VVQVSGGTLTRTSSVTPFKKSKSNVSGEIGSTQFLEQGFRPALFFAQMDRGKLWRCDVFI
jgi:hypothetical protein